MMYLFRGAWSESSRYVVCLSELKLALERMQLGRFVSDKKR